MNLYGIGYLYIGLSCFERFYFLFFFFALIVEFFQEVPMRVKVQKPLEEFRFLFPHR